MILLAGTSNLGFIFIVVVQKENKHLLVLIRDAISYRVLIVSGVYLHLTGQGISILFRMLCCYSVITHYPKELHAKYPRNTFLRFVYPMTFCGGRTYLDSDTSCGLSKICMPVTIVSIVTQKC